MITEEQEKQLRQLQEVFLEENSKLNLSAFRDADAVWNGNILDSLPFLDYLQSLSSIHYPLSTLLDVGTGGGFPLLPLAICLPDVKLTGLDSTQKKLDAIERMADQLDLKNVHLLSGRAEELGHDPQYREQFDIVTARAFAPLNVLIELCAPFVKKGGHLVAWKSMKVKQELEESLLARAELSCHLVDTLEYDLDKAGLPAEDPKGAGWGKRQLLIFKKTSETPKKYPRDTGVPKKSPLQ